MANYRINRINQEITREMTEILRQIKDPRVSENFVSVTGAECAPDLHNANIYYSVLPKAGCELTPNLLREVEKGLRSATGFIRLALAKTLNLRSTPELNFVYDPSIAHGSDISSALKKIEAELAESDSKSDESDETDESDNAGGADLL